MLITISDNVRIEDAPPRKTAIATEQLLSDAVTASHYQVGGLDALGKVIELGEPMDYIDWKAPAADRVWNVYQREEAGARFTLAATYPTLEEANAFALTL